MPYVINRPATKRLRALAAKVALAGTLVVPAVGLASSPAMAATTSCSPPVLSQPFLAWGDTNQYTLMPGESPDNFDGAAWTLSGGATLTSTQLADGSTGMVLNLPSGSSAISPLMCLDSSMQTARTMVRDVVGSQGVVLYLNYPSSPGWQKTGRVRGSGTGWTLSSKLNLQTSSLSGWTLGQFKLVAGGSTSDFQLYNFYVDPYAKG